MKMKIAVEFEIEIPENELDYVFIPNLRDRINNVVESNIDGIKGTGEYNYLFSEYDCDAYEYGIFAPMDDV